MKHKTVERIWSLVLGNGIYLFMTWLAWEDFHGINWFMGFFAIIGMVALPMAINYFIVLNTREKDEEN